jgi:hypothetical protein
LFQVEQAASDTQVSETSKRRVRISDALPWCFLLFVFGVPFSIVWAHIALGLWLLVWLISLALGQTQWKRTPLDVPVIIFLGVDLLTGLLGIDPAKSLVHFVSLWHVAIYMLVVNTVTDEKWLRRGLAVLLISAGLNACYGIAQNFIDGLYFFRDQQFIFHWSTSITREVGTFDHSMTFAGQMVLVGLLGVSLLLWWKRIAAVWRWGFPIVIILIALILSNTRNAWVGELVGLLALGLMKGKRFFIGIGIAVIFVILLMSTLEPSFYSRVKSIGDTELHANRERFDMAKVTFEMFKVRPLLGVGGGNYGQASEPYRQKFGVISKSHPQNNLLSQTAEKGLLGLAAFLYIWYVFFKESWFAWKNTTDAFSQALAAGGIAALIGFHVAGMFEANFGDSEVAMMMWLMVGFVMWVLLEANTISSSRLSYPS